ncbi:hypothetical protein BDK51DRAFT_48010 [Blyttiomyces helicus]|uniref:YTH domain-containing protein n=1 Tax=Blyttiomyces helicus TaxID=388810 RepID=A0A4P9WKK9_9FUNG|nr:hypothetical protein BDK51DRAFT_48010 [Blyttiomyces helicus]|eukprot:RKO91146.1 hypothetical protein BDK51DRAFT_48010 [Blyttiomyces helicus]
METENVLDDILNDVDEMDFMYDSPPVAPVPAPPAPRQKAPAPNLPPPPPPAVSRPNTGLPPPPPRTAPSHAIPSVARSADLALPPKPEPSASYPSRGPPRARDEIPHRDDLAKRRNEREREKEKIERDGDRRPPSDRERADRDRGSRTSDRAPARDRASDRDYDGDREQRDKTAEKEKERDKVRDARKSLDRESTGKHEKSVAREKLVERDPVPVREKPVERAKAVERDPIPEREKPVERAKPVEREREKEKSSERGKDRERGSERDREKDRDRKRDRVRSSDKEKEKEKERVKKDPVEAGKLTVDVSKDATRSHRTLDSAKSTGASSAREDVRSAPRTAETESRSKESARTDKASSSTSSRSPSRTKARSTRSISPRRRPATAIQPRSPDAEQIPPRTHSRTSSVERDGGKREVGPMTTDRVTKSPQRAKRSRSPRPRDAPASNEGRVRSSDNDKRRPSRPVSPAREQDAPASRDKIAASNGRPASDARTKDSEVRERRTSEQRPQSPPGRLKSPSSRSKRSSSRRRSRRSRSRSPRRSTAATRRSMSPPAHKPSAEKQSTSKPADPAPLPAGPAMLKVHPDRLKKITAEPAAPRPYTPPPVAPFARRSMRPAWDGNEGMRTRADHWDPTSDALERSARSGDIPERRISNELNVSPASATLREGRSHTHRFFLMTCSNTVNLQFSMDHGVWSVPAEAKQAIREAYLEAANVYLIFTLQDSKHLHGQRRWRCVNTHFTAFHRFPDPLPLLPPINAGYCRMMSNVGSVLNTGLTEHAGPDLAFNVRWFRVGVNISIDQVAHWTNPIGEEIRTAVQHDGEELKEMLGCRIMNMMDTAVPPPLPTSEVLVVERSGTRRRSTGRRLSMDGPGSYPQQLPPTQDPAAHPSRMWFEEGRGEAGLITGGVYGHTYSSGELLERTLCMAMFAAFLSTLC